MPIRGVGYTWGIDFAGPFPVTKRGNKYVLVMIEHFTKWVELVALRDKTAAGTAWALVEYILIRLGAPVEVVTDQGSEFRGDFQDVLTHIRIDYRLDSRKHLQADGLAERMVQTMKQGLRKTLLERAATDWDLVLPYVAMGYRMTQQKALGYSPYYILFGRHPISPSRIQELEYAPLPSLDDPEAVRLFIDERSQVF